MAWEQYVIEAAATDLDELEHALLDCGAIAVSLEDAGDTPILEPGPGETPLWPRIRVRALFDSDASAADIVARLEAVLPGHAGATVEPVADRDWSLEWLAQARPLWFANRLCVAPATLAPRDGAGAAIVVLDPGLAFGTGSHPSTAACLEWLATAELTGARVLDYGCGSGVLAIAACKLGAVRATAVDIDPQARTACLENARRNGCAGSVSVLAPEHLAACGYDVVLANILARPLIGLAPVLATLVREGGSLLLAGLLADQVEAVKVGYGSSFDFGPARLREEWASLAGTRRRDGP